MTTIREELQDIIRAIDKANGRINGLRDYAELHEKKFYNAARTALFKAMSELNECDDQMTDVQAASKL